MGLSPRLLASAVLCLVVFPVPDTALAQWSSYPQIREDIALPADPLGGEIVHPYGTEVPEVSSEFLRVAGGKWLLVWDRTLNTPRLGYPSEPRPLFTKEGDPLLFGTGDTPSDRAAEAARLFVTEHAEFFGVTPEELNLATTPFDGGYLVSGHQVHEGLPVRGSGFHLRLSGELLLRSFAARVARGLPPVPAPQLDSEGAAARAVQAGLTPHPEVRPHVQIAFPNGIGAPIPAWRVWGTDIDGEGVEEIYDASTGHTALSRRTALRLEISVTLDGFCPPVEDIFALPSEIAPDPQPIPEVTVKVLATEIGTNRRLEHEDATDQDGVMGAEFVTEDRTAQFFIQFAMGVQDRFHYLASPGDVLPRFYSYIDGHDFQPVPTQEVVATFNDSPRTEFESFHLMSYHHMLRALTRIGDVAIDNDVPFREKDVGSPSRKGAKLTLKRTTYGHSYEPDIQRIQLHNDEILEVDTERGRLRKIVPTIIHHEYAHHAIHLLSGGIGEVEVNEGVSDAIATFVAETNRFGFHRGPDLRPTADAHARDLRDDKSSFPTNPRATIAGAIRELFRATINGIRPRDREDPDFDEARTSGFTFQLVVKWLGSKRVHDGGALNSLPLEFSPLLGWELLVVGDPLELQNDPDGDSLTRGQDLRHAFGRRNLFPHAFLRGDSNGDADVDIADALKTFNVLFLGDTVVDCMDAMDTDDSGQVDISDGISVLLFLFAGGSPPAAPALDCGWDVTSGDGLGCFKAPCTYFP